MNTRPKILLLEDDAGVALLQRRCLERAGNDVHAVATTEEAWPLLTAGGFDLAIFDYLLAGNQTGLDFYERLRAAGHDLPVIVVTGFSEESTVIDALRRGVRDFVPKSSSYLEYLPVAVQRVLGQIRTEQALVRSNEQLRQAQKMEAVGRLAGGVAHEFNNLLQVIMGYGSVVSQKIASDQPLYEDMQEILKAAGRAAALTKQLLTFGRRYAPRRETANVSTIASDLIKMLRPLLGKHIEVELKNSETPAPVFVDSGMIQQAVMNLCLNARDAMPSGGKLLIETELAQIDAEAAQRLGNIAPGTHAVIRVTDDGEGISPENLPHLFEPFFTTKDVGQGTGLGLATVFAIVQEHHGAIEVASTLNIGTTFTIYLPRAEQQIGIPAIKPAGTAGGTETLLIAEDEPAIRNFLYRTLRAAGYTVLTAADGEEAIRLFNDQPGAISLVLLDMIMPRKVGRDVHEAIRAVRPDLPTVFISGYDPQAAQVAFVRELGLEMVQKPIGRDQLLSVVRRLLDEAAQRRPLKSKTHSQ